MARPTKQQRIDELEARLAQFQTAADAEIGRQRRAFLDAELQHNLTRAKAARITAVIWWAPAGTMSDRAGYAFDLVAGNRVVVASSGRVWPTPGQAKRAALAVSPGCTVKMPPRRKRGA